MIFGKPHPDLQVYMFFSLLWANNIIYIQYSDNNELHSNVIKIFFFLIKQQISLC